MATTFKTLNLKEDVATTRTLLHESIPITGSILSGTYTAGGTLALGSEQNIKKYSHGMFQSIYDYPYLSSSANHIFDMTLGYASNSPLYGSSNSQNDKKVNIYNQMAQVLMGYDETGSVRQFDEDGNIVAGGTKLTECVFFNFSRILSKDEIKKGSFQMEFGVSASFSQTKSVFNKRIKVLDSSGSNGYFVNSPAGEYGILYATSSNASFPYLAGETLGDASTNPPVGLLFYQAGIAVLNARMFNIASEGGKLNNTYVSSSVQFLSGAGYSGLAVVTGSTIDTVVDSIRNRIYNISFNNTTELNSTIYFCRVNNTDFNYSSNPTYLSGTNGGTSEIVVKNFDLNTEPATYITTVGLYSADDELLAVAKLSEPLKKTPSNEITLRVRLDY